MKWLMIYNLNSYYFDNTFVYSNNLLLIILRNITWMRKTSQSMYQSNLKVPVTASKVFDGSNLYKSTTAIGGKYK